MSEVRVGSSEVRVSAMEELRRLLDERGADYRVSAIGYSIDIGPYTTAYANRSDTTLDVSLRQVTPEQAIDATLGRGTCKNVGYYIDSTRFECSACGYNGWTRYAAYGEDRVPRYCPNCGRRVVGE